MNLKTIILLEKINGRITGREVITGREFFKSLKNDRHQREES